jgi:ribosome biogenesis GTPase A
VLLVDLTDVGGTLLGGIKDTVGASPVLLVGTKADLLPAGWRPERVAAWLARLAALRGLQPLQVLLVSSHTGAGEAPTPARAALAPAARSGPTPP